jgi:hypothetical protein
MKRYRVLVAAVAACLWLASTAMSASYFNRPEVISPDSFVAGAIKDCPAMWKAIKASPLYREYQKLMSNPLIAENVKYKEFQLEMKKYEVELGFPLNADTILGQMCRGVDLAVIAPKTAGQEAAVSIFFYVSDMPKAEKLVSFLVKKASEPPKQVGTTPPVATPPPPKVTTEVYKGVTLKSGPNPKAHYCFVGDTFVFCNTLAALKEAVDRLKGESAGSVEQKATLEMAKQYIVPSAYQCTAYVNYKEFMNAIAGSAPGFSVMQLSGMQGMPEMPFIAGVNFSPTHVRMDSFMALDKETTTSKILQSHKPQSQFALAGFIPSTTLVAQSSNMFAGVTTYDELYTGLTELFKMMSMGMGPSAQDSNIKADMDAGVKKFEREVGFKIRDDFFASIGPETLFTLNSVKFQMPFPIPVIDLAFIVETRDKAKVAKMMSQLEAYVNRKIAQSMGQTGQGTTPPALMIQFLEIEHFGTKIRYLSIPTFPMYSPSYAFSDGNLIIGLTLDGIKNVLDSKQGRMNSFVASEQFKAAQPYLPPPYNEYSIINIASIIDTIKSVMISQNPDYQNDKDTSTVLAILDAIKAMQSLQAASRGTPQGLLSNSVVLLK